jgi:uncharacterized membrane protein
MNWILFASLTIVFYSLFDFFLKMSSDKIHAYWGGFIVNLVATIVMLVFVFYAKFHGEKIFEVKPNGVLFSIFAGISVGLVTVFFFKMFATGVNLSIGAPLVRVGMVVLASILGIVLLKEGINLRYVVGIFVSLLGLYLILTK